jgi:hypothetical protein
LLLRTQQLQRRAKAKAGADQRLSAFRKYKALAEQSAEGHSASDTPEKIRIVLEGLRGEESISELCRHCVGSTSANAVVARTPAAVQFAAFLRPGFLWHLFQTRADHHRNKDAEYFCAF